MTEQELKQTVSEHAIQLSVVASHIGDMKDAIKEIARSYKSQELVLEKLTNIEISHTSSKDRIHKILEKHEARLDAVDKVLDSTCPVVDVSIKTLDDRVKHIEKVFGFIAKTVGGILILALLGLILIKA